MAANLRLSAVHLLVIVQNGLSLVLLVQIGLSILHVQLLRVSQHLILEGTIAVFLLIRPHLQLIVCHGGASSWILQ